MYEFKGITEETPPVSVVQVVTVAPLPASAFRDTSSVIETTLADALPVTCRACCRLVDICNARLPRRQWTRAVVGCQAAHLFHGDGLGLDEPHYCLDYAGLYAAAGRGGQ